MALLLAYVLGSAGCGSPGAEVDEPEAESAPPVESAADSDDSADGDSVAPCTDGDADGWCAPEDCDDTVPAIHPGVPERCNEVDDDCDGAVDEGVQRRFYRDDDSDGYGSTESIRACTAPGGYASQDGDCADWDPSAFPGGTEVCDLSDNDCDGSIDEGNWPRWYLDVDGDGYGDPLLHSCTRQRNYVVDGTDCLDLDADVHPGAEERCDGLDDDCDGIQDASDVDADADGQPICAGDCDDQALRVAADAPELCGDGLDNDCDGTTDLGCVDDHCDWTVPSQVATIRGAMAAAKDGDTVCVEPGTYDEYVRFGGKDVNVIGLGGSAATFLVPDPARGAVTFAPREGRAAVFEGFTVQGGGHVDIEYASPTLVDVVVEDAYDDAWSGAFNARGGSPAFWGVVVRNATVSVGPKSEGSGGGFRFLRGFAVLDDVEVEDSYAGGGGGAIYGWWARLTLANVVFRGNHAAGNWGTGGGMESVASLVRMRNARIVDNRTTEGWETGAGGGLSLTSSILFATNVTICGNEDWMGGQGFGARDSVVVITNGIVCENDATSGGRAGVEAVGSAVRFRYSDLWGNTPADVWGLPDPIGGWGNISVDPVFADADDHLDPTSPLVDAGDPRLLDADGSRSDVGAYGGSGGW